MASDYVQLTFLLIAFQFYCLCVRWSQFKVLFFYSLENSELRNNLCLFHLKMAVTHQQIYHHLSLQSKSFVTLEYNNIINHLREMFFRKSFKVIENIFRGSSGIQCKMVAFTNYERAQAREMSCLVRGRKLFYGQKSASTTYVYVGESNFYVAPKPYSHMILIFINDEWRQTSYRDDG